MSVLIHGNRNLLFGVLACELKYLDQSELVAAARHIIDERPFGDFLLERNLIEEETFQFIDALVEYYLARNGDASQSIHAIQPDPDLCERVIAAIEPETDNQSTFARQIAARSADSYQSNMLGEPTLEQRFKILRPHAKGGLGEVLIAHDSELNRKVALKRIQSWHADQTDSRNRFVVEAEITGALEHPGIVPIYGKGTMDDGRPFYAMRYIEGQSLKAAIEQHYRDRSQTANDSSVAFRKLLSAYIDACNTIAFAHSRGVLHRDIKPGNIMLGPFGETHVVDWGLAKILDGPQLEPSENPPLKVSSGSSLAPTQLGSTIGTPTYMSPEQAAGDPTKLDIRSDTYSLGATLYTILTGEMPFEKNSQILEHVQEGSFRRPTSVRNGVPRPLESICLKAMSRDPDERYASSKGIAEDVERWLADQPVRAHKDSISERFNRMYRRNRNSFLVAATLLLLSLGGLLAANNATRRANEDLTQQVALFEQLSEENSIMAFEAVDGGISFTKQGIVVANVVKIFRAYFAENPTSIQARRKLANALRIRGIQHKVMGQERNAIECLEEAVTLLENVALEEPTEESEYEILRTRNELASTLQQRHLHKSKTVLDQCIATLNRLA
ncbi:MAG: serine/threonine-protein kinase, partial [Planctomycetota bacterium]